MRICRLMLLGISWLALASSAPGQVLSVDVDILSPGDSGYEGVPDGLAVIDVFVDVALTDVWTAAGVHVYAFDGAAFQYFDSDPNTDGLQPGLVNPGIANRFMTSISKPRARNGNARFTNGLVGVAGSYDGSPTQITTPTELNVAYFASPPESPTSPASDGWIARIAVDISQTPYAVSDLVIVDEPQDDAIVACQSFRQPWGFAYATYDVPALDGGSFWVIPEPATCTGLLILISGFSALQRRARLRR